jgi:hypothetical protein
MAAQGTDLKDFRMKMNQRTKPCRDMDDRRQQLIELGPERLADALLELAQKSEWVGERVERILIQKGKAIMK